MCEVPLPALPLGVHVRVPVSSSLAPFALLSSACDMFSWRRPEGPTEGSRPSRSLSLCRACVPLPLPAFRKASHPSDSPAFACINHPARAPFVRLAPGALRDWQRAPFLSAASDFCSSVRMSADFTLHLPPFPTHTHTHTHTSHPHRHTALACVRASAPC